MKQTTRLLLALGLVAGTMLVMLFGRGFWHPLWVKASGGQTLAQAIDSVDERAKPLWLKRFQAINKTFPPKHLTWVAYKKERRLDVWDTSDKPAVLVHSYPIQAASGQAGPKLREGDRQVPEGMYRIEGFNPNSSYHLSMKLNYPNAFDLTHAKAEGRDQPGTNIFIHGKAVSIGCLAMGDEAIEELFYLAYASSRKNIDVIIAPHDPSNTPLNATPDMPVWTEALYQDIQTALDGTGIR